MKRSSIVLLHGAYWIGYTALIALVLTLPGLPDRVPSWGALLGAWPILVIAVAPNVAAFYLAYGPLFTRYLARRRVLSLSAGACAAAAGASIVALALAGALFGAAQPVFARPFELASLAGVLCALAALHAIAALFVRGFVDWYADIGVKEALTTRNTETELALLRARLNPHFLFNTLNNIDMLIACDPARASRYLNTLSDLLRFALFEAKQDTIPLSEEIAYIDRYIELERIRTRHAGYAAHEVIGDPADLRIAPMTFIPFIENAFKHTEGRREDGAIRSRLAIDGGTVLFECTNRIASGGEAHARTGGLGLEIARRRLDLLYPHRHALAAGAQDGCYAVRLRIDL